MAAFREARLRRCPLRVVHAWQDPSTDVFTLDDGDIAWPEVRPVGLEVLRRNDSRPTAWLRRCPIFPEVAVEHDVDWRRPTVALQDGAKGAQLLVVGSRGRGAFKGLVMGSTSRVMIQHAPCPVLVVPSDPDVVPSHPKSASARVTIRRDAG